MFQNKLIIVCNSFGQFLRNRRIPCSLLFLIFSRVPGHIGLASRFLWLKQKAKHCGNNIYIGENVTMKNVSNLSIGSNVSIHECCYLDALGGIYIGDHVSIAHNSSLLSTNHTYFDKKIPIKYNKVSLAPLVIQDDVWVGAGCRLLAGVTVQTRVIVAAGAVLTKDAEPFSLYGGVPAVKLKSI